MWEEYEGRLEAEHYLAPEVRAKALIERLMSMPAETSEEAFRAELGALTYPDLRTFFNRITKLAGPTGDARGEAEAGRRQPDQDRLLTLHAVALAVISEAAKARTDHFTAQDVEAVQACTPIDKQMADAFRAAYQRRATADDVDTLETAARGYEAINNRASLSEAGRRVLMLRRAAALDGLARACATDNRHLDADGHFKEAAALYARARDEHQAAACLRERDAAAQRHMPNTDARLKQLLDRVQKAPSPSVDRARILTDLAELASGNHDDFEAEQRLNSAVAELAAAGYAVPEPGGTDGAFMRWVEAIPPGDGEEPIPFQRQINALLTVQHRVAGLRVTLALRRRGDDGRPGRAIAGVTQAEAELQLSQLTEIINELPVHAEAVQARLESQLDESVPPDFSAGSTSARAREFAAIHGATDELRDLTAKSLPDSPETLARWRQMATDLIARARAYGQPVNLAQALGVAASVEEAAEELNAAVDLLKDAYAQVAHVPGKQAADQAIITLSRIAKIQFVSDGLNGKKAALATASTAIELIERDRYRVSAQFQRAGVLEQHADLFTIGIFAAWKVATDDTTPDQADYDRMLQLMELAKARASVRQLFLATAPADAGLDQNFRALNDAIHAAGPVAGPADSAEEHERRSEQARLRLRRLELWDRRAISMNDPGAEVPPVTLAGLQATLEPDEAIIYYYWLLPLSLLVVTITADAIVVERKLPDQDQRTRLERLIRELGSLTGSNRSLDAAFIEPLASVLTPVDGLPLLAGKQRLIVSPHRLLHWFPFAAMPYQGRPLVRSFAVRYAPNLTSLLVPRPDPCEPRLTVLGVSEFPGRPGLGELSGVRRVAADLTAIYSEADIPLDVMREPTRGEVLAAMRDGALVRSWCAHLDTHGHSLMDEVSKDAPLESVLELADNSVDGYEIAAARLDCEVVVLTACFAGQRAISGRGRAEQPGDELFGISAAFLDARCRSVLAPAWPADHEAISQIITEFHRGLAQGFPADIALAQAQRAFLDTADFVNRPAYYWAPLVLTAIGRPMPLPRNAPA